MRKGYTDMGEVGEAGAAADSVKNVISDAAAGAAAGNSTSAAASAAAGADLTMECAVFYGVEDMRVERRPTPVCPPGGLLVRVKACGICGSDVRNYYNGFKDGKTDRIMGHEIAGVVVEKSAGADDRFVVGDRVALAPDISCGACYYCRRGLVNLCVNHKMLGTHYQGGFAQYIPIPGEVLSRGFIEKMPVSMSFSDAAFSETAAGVLACQKRIGVSLGDSVLIIGDGPVACLHAEAARARGCGSVMMAGLDKLALAAAFSPDLLLDNRNPGEVNERVLERTGGIGADFVICAVPSAAVQSQALSLCRKRGVMVIYGGVPKSSENTVLNSNLIHYNEITVTGAFSYPATGLSDALDAIRSGHIRPRRYISLELPLGGVHRGVEAVRSGEALKVMLLP